MFAERGREPAMGSWAWVVRGARGKVDLGVVRPLQKAADPAVTGGLPDAEPVVALLRCRREHGDRYSGLRRGPRRSGRSASAGGGSCASRRGRLWGCRRGPADKGGPEGAGGSVAPVRREPRRPALRGASLRLRPRPGGCRRREESAAVAAGRAWLAWIGHEVAGEPGNDRRRAGAWNLGVRVA